MTETINGVLNIYKEKGYTSHDVVAIVRRLLHVKAGHTGTLDPDATGVLPICLGKATKIADYIAADIKGYRAVLRLGLTTDTQDASGTVLSTAGQRSLETLTKEEILAAIRSFIGPYDQLPPMYSAIKINGEKLYDLARKGMEVARKTRLIHIHEINDITFLDDITISMDILCSKGTYVRTLCHDIGQALGCGGIMSELERTRAGKMAIDTSVSLNILKEAVEAGEYHHLITPMDRLLDYPKVRAEKTADKFLYNGNKVSQGMVRGAAAISKGDKALLYNGEDQLVGIYEKVEEAFKPVTILADLEQLR